jgi:hypothetical protein
LVVLWKRGGRPGKQHDPPKIGVSLGRLKGRPFLVPRASSKGCRQVNGAEAGHDFF